MNRICSFIFSIVFINCSFAQTIFPSGFLGAKINRNGDVCGTYRITPGAVNLPYIFHNDGTSTPLPLLPNTIKGNALDINNSGSCVGILEKSNGEQVGVFWDNNHNPSPLVSVYNELPVALNDNGEFVFNATLRRGITENGCNFGENPYPDLRPVYSCGNQSFTLPNSPVPGFPQANGMVIVGMNEEQTTFAVNQNYNGVWRADLHENSEIVWNFLDPGAAYGLSVAATHDHSDLFGYTGEVGRRVGTIWHPLVLLNGNLNYGETVFLRNTLNIADTSTGNNPLRLVFRSDGKYETRSVVKAADMNCDGKVDNFDIDYFLGSLGYISPSQQGFPGTRLFPDMPLPCQYTDFNSDGYVNFLDVDYFVSELIK